MPACDSAAARWCAHHAQACHSEGGASRHPNGRHRPAPTEESTRPRLVARYPTDAGVRLCRDAAGCAHHAWRVIPKEAPRGTRTADIARRRLRNLPGPRWWPAAPTDAGVRLCRDAAGCAHHAWRVIPKAAPRGTRTADIARRRLRNLPGPRWWPAAPTDAGVRLCRAAAGASYDVQRGSSAASQEGAGGGRRAWRSPDRAQ